MTSDRIYFLRILLPTILALCVANLFVPEVEAKQESTLAFAGVGITAGGDNIDESPEENPSSGILNFDVDLTAGGEFHVWFGTIWLMNNTVETLFAVGYHNDSQTFTGGSSNFGQITYDVIPMYRHGEYRIGAGVAYHTNVRYSKTTTSATDGSKTTVDTNFQDALGKVISVGYDFSKRGRMDIRYQFIDAKQCFFVLSLPIDVIGPRLLCPPKVSIHRPMIDGLFGLGETARWIFLSEPH